MELLIAFAVFVATSCAAKLDQLARISHGWDADVNQFPHMVLLEAYENGYEEICGASLISRKWVLTAAHCVYIKWFVGLYLGSIYIDRAAVSYLVNRGDIKVHFLYNPQNFENDIALIRIPETKICSGIAPVPLPKKSDIHQSYAQEAGIAAGWGRTSQNGPAAYRLQWAPMPIISVEDCKALTTYGFADSMLCVDTSDFTSICEGDSGGPLVLATTGELIGVASKTSSLGCQAGKPAVFTRITTFLRWIEANTGIAYE